MAAVYATASGPRMSAGVGGFQTLHSDVRVDLGGREARVAQERLNAPEVCAAVEQVRRETVPELVRADVRGDRGVNQVPLEKQPRRACIETAP